MAILKPFTAIRYNPEKIEDMSKVMAPPYDVISPEYQDELYRRHKSNVIRLILGKTECQSGGNRYTRAADYLGEWLGSEDVLLIDETPAFYYYTQTYRAVDDDKERTRKGFIGLARVEEPGGKGGVHAHEKTLSGPKADRLNLMKAAGTNFSSIFTLYPEDDDVKPEDMVTGLLDSVTTDKGLPPLIEVTDDEGVVNRLWKVCDAEVIERITAAMADKDLFIADGHHRYATALNYKNYMLENTPGATGDEPFNYVMMYFTSMEDKGLEVFPTHRVLHSVVDFDGNELLEKCSEYFDIEEFVFNDGDDTNEVAVREKFLSALGSGEREKTRLGLCLNGLKKYFVLILKSPETMDEIFGADMADVYKTLDVTVLHSLVLDKMLGIDQLAQESQKHLTYVKKMDQAIAMSQDGENQAVFFMNSTKVSDVKNVSQAGLLMPQKSTYFYPKLLTGLVMNPLRTMSALCP